MSDSTEKAKQVLAALTPEQRLELLVWLQGLEFRPAAPAAPAAGRCRHARLWPTARSEAAWYCPDCGAHLETKQVITHG